MEQAPISELCFENGAAAFQPKARPNQSAEQRIAYLEKQIQTKDELPAELMAEHVALKNGFGDGRFMGWLNPDGSADG